MERVPLRCYQQWNEDLRGTKSLVRVGSLSPGMVDTEGVRAHVHQASGDVVAVFIL